MSADLTTKGTPTKREVLDAISTIDRSRFFAKADSQFRILKHLVSMTLEGAGEGHFKEGAIGSVVLNRPTGYDLVLDPIARVTIRRLRDKLAKFYQTPEGRTSPVRISLARGSYVPTFCYTGQGGVELDGLYERLSEIHAQLEIQHEVLARIESEKALLFEAIMASQPQSEEDAGVRPTTLANAVGLSEAAYLEREPLSPCSTCSNRPVYHMPLTWAGMLYLYSQDVAGQPPRCSPFRQTTPIKQVLEALHYKAEGSLFFSIVNITLGCMKHQLFWPGGNGQRAGSKLIH